QVSWMLRLLTLPFVERFADVASPERVRGALLRQVYDPATIGADFVNAEYENWSRPGNRLAFLNALRCNITLLGVRRWRRHLLRASLLALPVLIIWGRNDRTIGVKHAYRAAKRIAGARLTILDRCGHLAP